MGTLRRPVRLVIIPALPRGRRTCRQGKKVISNTWIKQNGWQLRIQGQHTSPTATQGRDVFSNLEKRSSGRTEHLSCGHLGIPRRGGFLQALDQSLMITVCHVVAEDPYTTSKARALRRRADTKSSSEWIMQLCTDGLSLIATPLPSITSSLPAFLAPISALRVPNFSGASHTSSFFWAMAKTRSYRLHELLLPHLER